MLLNGPTGAVGWLQGHPEGYPRARSVLNGTSFHSANSGQALGVKGAVNKHLNLVLIYQCVYDSLLTKLPGRMEQSPVSQRSNEPVTMEMSLLPLPTPRQARGSGAASGKLAVPEGCARLRYLDDSPPQPRVGWRICRKWLGAGMAAGQGGLGHVPPTWRQLEQADRCLW